MIRPWRGHIQRTIAAALVIGFSLSSLFLSPIVSAATATSSSIGIVPRKDYTILPGGSISDTLAIENINAYSGLSVSIKVIDFSAQGQSGTPQFNFNTAVSPTPWSLRPYTTVPSTTSLPAKSASTIPLTIKLPNDIGPGSYYSAIEYSASQSSSDQKQVSLSASAATLVFVTVPGQAKEQLTTKKFGAYTPGTNNSPGSFQATFYTSKPKEMAFLLDNQGNVAEVPVGSIVIKNLWGKQVAVIQQANQSNVAALRGQTRLFEACIMPSTQTVAASYGQSVTELVCKAPSFHPGIYHATLDLFYGIKGSNPHEVTASATFVYLPVWYMVILLVIILIIIALFWFLVVTLQRRRYLKRHHQSHHKKA